MVDGRLAETLTMWWRYSGGQPGVRSGSDVTVGAGIAMQTNDDREVACLDEHRPSWITVGRTSVQGICADLIAAASHLVQASALTAVILPAGEFQLETVVGTLRGKTLDTVPLLDSGILEVASSGAGTPVEDTVEHALAARLRLAAVRAIPLDTADERVGLLIVGWDAPEHPQPADLSRLRDLGQQAALAILNLTLRHQLARVQRLERDASALVRAASDLAFCRPAETLHNRIVSYAKDMVGAQLAFLALLDEERQDLVITTTCGEHSRLLTGARMALNEGVAALAIRNRTTVIVPDLMTDSRRRPSWEGIRLAESIHGSVWAPIFAGEQLLGVLGAANRHVTQFTDDEAGILQQLADVAALCMQDAGMYEQQHRANLELQRLSQINVARCSEAQRQAAVMVALASALWSSQGFDALSSALARWLNNPVVICNQSRRVLTCKDAAGSSTAEPPQALIAALAQPKSRLSLVLTKGRSRSHPRRVVLPGIQGGSISCVVAAIGTDEAPAGYLLVPEFHGSLQEAELAVLESAIPFFAAEFRRHSEVGRARESLGADLLLDLLEGGATEHSTSQANLLGCSLDEQYAMGVFHMGSNGDPLHRHKRKSSRVAPELLLAAVRAELQSPSCATGFALSAVHDGLVVIAVPRGLQANQWKEMHTHLCARFADAPITMALSPSFRGMAGILPAYRNCLWMLQAAIRLSRVGRVVRCEELGVYRLLGKVHPHEDLVEFARGVLGGLLSEDSKYKFSLLPTLDAYLRNSCRVQKTAKALFVHPHTLRYRIGRIEDILGHGVDDPDWREEAHLALAIARVEFPELFEGPNAA